MSLYLEHLVGFAATSFFFISDLVKNQHSFFYHEIKRGRLGKGRHRACLVPFCDFNGPYSKASTSIITSSKILFSYQLNDLSFEVQQQTTRLAPLSCPGGIGNGLSSLKEVPCDYYGWLSLSLCLSCSLMNLTTGRKQK